jgi:2,4-dienoyl-CoA reductase-like NADH-dependent reductase (Old Yellow Enzyme family)
VSSLGSPFRLTEAIELRNRFVATAHASGSTIGGLPSAGDADYWARLAAGGAAMAIAGGSTVTPGSSMRRGNLLEGWREDAVPGLRRRAAAIHVGGAVAIYQLIHLGRETLGAETYYWPGAPSGVRSPREPTAPHPMRDREIDEVIEAFRASAANVLACGFDGVELHAAHGYLLAQFLSPATNQRPEATTVAGRAGPVWRIVEEIRGLSPTAVIGIRLSVGDPDDAGLDGAQLAELLVALPAGIDYVNLTVGMRNAYVRDMASASPPLLELVPELRKLTSLPLLISHGFRDRAAMEGALSGGADLVGMARALIADPQLPAKLLSGNARRVRPCVACNEDCRAFDPVLLCSVNPDLAPPGESVRPASPLVLRHDPNAGPARTATAGDARVAVVGAGPAGLECAITLAQHPALEVVVYERSKAIGGSLAVAGAAPHRHGWLALVDFHRAGLEDNDVQLRLGVEPSAAELESYDAVVLACGAEELLPEAAMPAPAGTPSLARTSSAAIAAGAEALVGVSHLVVVDDGFAWWPSVSAVELAVAAGAAEVTLVTPGVAFATGIPTESRSQLLARLRGVRLTIRPLSSLAGVGDGDVELRHVPTGRSERIAADAAIVVGERRPLAWEPLVPAGPPAVVIGDAIVPRRVAHAVSEGRAAAALISGTVRGPARSGRRSRRGVGAGRR